MKLVGYRITTVRADTRETQRFEYDRFEDMLDSLKHIATVRQVDAVERVAVKLLELSPEEQAAVDAVLSDEG